MYEYEIANTPYVEIRLRCLSGKDRNWKTHFQFSLVDDQYQGERDRPRNAEKYSRLRRINQNVYQIAKSVVARDVPPVEK